MTSRSKVLLEPPAAALSWLGRQGARAVAALIVVGIALPPLGAMAKPLVTEAVFLLLCIAFVRVDAVAFRHYLSRPAIVILATAWTSLVVPAVFGAGYLMLGLREGSPDLFLALVLQAIAPPLMAAPALAVLVRLDATLVLCTMAASTALLPLTAPFFAHTFIGSTLALSPLTLGVKLLAILAGSALVGLVVRRVAGAAAIDRHREKIDGFNILVMLVFVAGMMENVAVRFIAAPLMTAGLAALAFVVAFAVLGLTILVFASTGRERALTTGFAAAERNTGLMLAATAGALPDLSWLYFAFSYFPLYLLPLLLQRLRRRAAPAERNEPR